MAHVRHRLIEAQLKQLLAFSPIVGVLGHRQVGKTTLVSSLPNRRYVTLDSPAARDLARSEPEAFVEGFPANATIDESQWAPELFPVLKERVRVDRRPGQFLLTGSVRFTSRRAIRESLTGRIAYLEACPLTVAELEGFKPRTRIPAGEELRTSSLSHVSVAARNQAFDRFCEVGGLPGVCFIRSAALRAQRWEDQLRTILDRDLRLIVETTLLYPTLRQLMSQLAARQGEPLEWAELSRATRISTPTLRKLLFALEGLFLLRAVPARGGTKKQTVFFEDPGEASFLAGAALDPRRRVVAALYANLRVQYTAVGATPEFHVFRTRGGAWVPLVVADGRRQLGLIPLDGGKPLPSDIGSARSFLAQSPGAEVFLLHRGTSTYRIQRALYAVPVAGLL